MAENVLSGDQMAWAQIVDQEPGLICKRAQVRHNFTSNKYTLISFGQEIQVDPSNYKISSHTPAGEQLLHGFGYFFDLAILWYIGSAKNIPLSGRLVSPSSLSGGEIFQRGTHVLPLDRLAARYGNDLESFYKKGLELGGQQLKHGDASLRLYPFPRVPVTYILWQEDEEFPARVDMFFDTTSEQHLPTDVIWSTAMTSVLILL
jgi:hypothetical protein